MLPIRVPKPSRADLPSSAAPEPRKERSVDRSAELSTDMGSTPSLVLRLDAVPDPNDILSDSALRGRALPAPLYAGAAVIASAAIAMLSDWASSDSPAALRAGLACLVGALALGAALLLLRRGRSLLAARVAIGAWLATTAVIGLAADPLTALAWVPAALAATIGLATVLDARSVLRWTLVSAGACAALMLARPEPAKPLLVLLPAALLLTLGLACRAAVRGRELARSTARSSHRALEERRALLHQSSVELARRDVQAVAAQTAVDAAEHASRTKSTFLAHMSHELRTPLNAILGYIELVRDEASERGMAQIVADTGRMETAGRHLLQVIGDILDLSKIEAGQVRLDAVRFDLGATLRDLIDAMRPAIARGSNLLVVEILLGQDPTIVGDPVYTRQIVFNLLANAAKFTEHGQIGLGVQRDGDWLELRVSDTGIGMNQEQIVRVFQPFEQAETSTARRYGGTGLGLTITLGLVKLMSGELTVDSAVGHGTVFLLRIPADSTRPPPARAPLPGPLMAHNSARFSTQRAHRS